MATRKKVIPKQKMVTVPRQKTTVAPRWNVLSQNGNSLIMDVSGFRDDAGRLDMARVHQAAKDYPGRSITFSERKTDGEYRGRSAFEIRQEEKLNPQKNAPKKAESAKKEKPITERRKTKTKIAVRAQDRKVKRETTRLDRTLKSVKQVGKAEKKQRAAIRKAPSKAPKAKLAAPKIGEVWDQKTPLRRYQYVDSSTGKVRSTSLSRIAKRQTAAENRQKRAALAEKRAAERQRAQAARKATAQQRAQLAAKVRKARDRMRQAWNAEQRTARRQELLRGAMKTRLTGYGKAPLKMLLAKDRSLGWKGKRFHDMPGRRGVLGTIPRSELYPAMNHSGAKPLKAPVSMRPVSGKLPLDLAKGKMLEGSRGNVFATTKTLTTGKFPVGGRGIVFMIDANEVLQNLTVRFPQILRETATAMSDRMGRRLLDIVEPYVPKDTGLLYSTAQTNTSQMAGGSIGLTGESPFTSETYGVTISYNAPYAELVYFNERARHGKEYNEEHGVSTKGELETNHWIEVAFEKEQTAIAAMYGEYAAAMTSALNTAGFKQRSFASGKGARSFWTL